MKRAPSVPLNASGQVPMAVIGVGYLGQHHARILGGLKGAELVAVCDILPEKKEEISEPLGARFFNDYRDLADHVSAVSIAVPTNLHYEIARFFLERGKGVLIEKPITADLKQASLLLELVQEKGLTLMVGHTERFNPAIIEARRHLDSPEFIESHRIGAFPGRSTDIDVLLDVMIHDIDLVLGTDRSGIKEVDAVGVAVLTDRIDIANARLKMHSGCVANLTASRVSQERLRKIRFFSRNQYLSVDCDKQKVRRVTLQRAEEGGKASIASEHLEIRQDEPLRIELECFVGNLINGTSPEVDGQAGLESLKAALAIRDCIVS
ncbi:Gfo/Idh/MocA family oxidoreductase [Acidobacteriota bacterium]